jgi:hypothetical protein
MDIPAADVDDYFQNLPPDRQDVMLRFRYWSGSAPSMPSASRPRSIWARAASGSRNWTRFLLT